MSPVSSSSVVVLSGKTRVSVKNQAESRKKMKRPTTAGAACRPRSTARSYPRTPARRQLGNFCREGWGGEELGGNDQHHPLAAKRCFKRPGMIRALKMMICDEVGQPTQGREWCFIGLEAAGHPASRHGDFPCAAGLCSLYFLRFL